MNLTYLGISFTRRAAADAGHPGEVAVALDAARAELGSADRQRHTGADRHRDASGMGRGSPGHPCAGVGSHTQGADQHAARDDGHADSMGGEGHDMSATEMPGMAMPPVGLPAGLPMARRGADRDGLKLDRLHVPLGPFLAHWPAGLVVQVTIQGDVVQQAEVTTLGAAQGGGSFWAEPWLRAAAGEPIRRWMMPRRSPYPSSLLSRQDRTRRPALRWPAGPGAWPWPACRMRPGRG